MITTCWDAGVHCSECGNLIELGSDMMYGRCMDCGRKTAQARNAEPASPQETLALARELLAAQGRIVFTRPQLRTLIALARSGEGFVPVRRPDKSCPTRWYGRLAGWDPARVERGLTAEETAGLWLDYLDVGRVPPVRHSDLSRLLESIDACAPAVG